MLRDRIILKDNILQEREKRDLFISNIRRLLF